MDASWMTVTLVVGGAITTVIYVISRLSISANLSGIDLRVSHLFHSSDRSFPTNQDTRYARVLDGKVAAAGINFCFLQRNQVNDIKLIIFREYIIDPS